MQVYLYVYYKNKWFLKRVFRVEIAQLWGGVNFCGK